MNFSFGVFVRIVIAWACNLVLLIVLASYMASWDISGSSSDRQASMISMECAVANPYSRRILSNVSLSVSSSWFQKRSDRARCIAVPETLKKHNTLTIYRRLTPGT